MSPGHAHAHSHNKGEHCDTPRRKAVPTDDRTALQLAHCAKAGEA